MARCSGSLAPLRPPPRISSPSISPAWTCARADALLSALRRHAIPDDELALRDGERLQLPSDARGGLPAVRRRPRAAVGVTRDSHGRIKRSEFAKRDFEHHHPCPSTGKTSGACPGYVVDHIVPLKRGGADDPSNMQWQTTGAAKEKDRWE